MRVLVSPGHFLSLVIVPLLAAVIAFPASAQTSGDSKNTTDAPAQTQVTGAASDSNPATSKAGSNAAAPSTTNSAATKTESNPGGTTNSAATKTESNPGGTTNSAATKTESNPGGAQPQTNPAPNKTGSAILINIDKAKQRMTVF